jgi:hypothetical protein
MVKMTLPFPEPRSINNRFRWYVDELLNGRFPIAQEVPGFSLSLRERETWKEDNMSRYLHTIYPPLTANQHAILDDDFGFDLSTGGKPNPKAKAWFAELRMQSGLEVVKLSDSFKEFLACTNGARLFANQLVVLGVDLPPPRRLLSGPISLPFYNVKNRERGMESRDVLVGYISGDSCCFQNADTGLVRCCLRADGEQIATWLSFEEFFETEFRRLEKMFDEQGKFIGDKPEDLLPTD